MPRALLVGCGCSAGEAGTELLARGWAVRGTSRRRERLERIAERGIEPVRADPDLVGSIVEQLGDVTVLAWLLGSAEGEAEAVAALHTQRLPSALRKLVDTPVRGLIYEAVGTVGEDALSSGRAALADASERWRIPARLIEVDRREPAVWARAVADAADDLIAA